MSSGGTPAGRQSLVAAATVSAGRTKKCGVVVVVLAVASAFVTGAPALAIAGSDTAEDEKT